MMLRAFLEAYGVVADELASLGDESSGPEAAFLSRCEARGASYVAEHRIRNPEAVSRHLFSTGLRLARNRGLADGDDDLARRRTEFAGQLAAVRGRMATVRRVAVRRVRALTGDDAGVRSVDGRAMNAGGNG